MSKVERHHREATALALSTGTRLTDYVIAWIAGGPAPSSVWACVAEALAAAEHRGASTRALELWADDVIDGWAASHSGFGFITDTDLGDHDTEEPWLCHVAHNDRGKVPALYLRFAGRGDSAPAARIAAARALRAAHPELPEEPKETT